MNRDLKDALDSLRARKVDLTDRLSKIDEAIDALQAVGDDSADRPRTIRPVPSASRTRRVRKSLRFVVIELLRSKGEPMTAREIAEELGRRGDPRIDLTKKDPSSPVRTALMTASGDGQVVRGVGGLWSIPTPRTVNRSFGEIGGFTSQTS